jgi:hypothetical protein
MVAGRSRAAAGLSLMLCCAIALSCSSRGSMRGTPPAPAPGQLQGRMLSVESAVWDFGSVKRGETVTRTLVLRNNTGLPIEVAAYSSCDCLTAEVDDELIAGDGTAELRLSFTGDTIKDKTTKTAYVYPRDNPLEKVTVTVTGRVTRGEGPHMEVLPTILLFEKTADAHGPASLRIMNLGGAELVVSEVRCFGCEASHRTFTLGVDEEIEIGVTLAGDWNQETYWMEIDSNDPVNETKKIPVMVMK